ncbi:hypothetical protein B5S30_g677 [[Candida] boidinii]|nr:hypothetical protein B5S30_g677 [[Candida] boidinii]
MTTSESQLKTSAPKSFVDSSFFTRFSELKLNEYKLDDSLKDVHANMEFKSLGSSQAPSISLNDSSLDTLEEFESSLPIHSNFIINGHIKNVNTLEDFKKINKLEFLTNAGKFIYDSIIERTILDDPTLLSYFQLLSFSDLKKYKYYYWFCFPTLESDWTMVKQTDLIDIDPQTINDFIVSSKNPISILKTSGENIEIEPFSNLSQFPTDSDLHLLFIDTSTRESDCHYSIQNLLTALAIYGYGTNGNHVEINIYRFHHENLNYRLILEYNGAKSTQLPKVRGWERTSQGRLGPKLADLGALINPEQLADQATDLNLKLMKWRVAPKLNLDTIKETKCLLLGSGTLGSYVGRCLLAWGVRKITFVDNGKVSFSNPVRQPLFNFEDCLNGGAPKSIAAAANMKKIFPSVDSQGFQLEVPMVGHPITNEETQRKDYDKLCELIDAHDVVFLLMDSRETRWLPTLIGNYKNKIVINSALGFESYLVMRHGNVKPEVLKSLQSNTDDDDDDDDEKNERLGCYFCNDVVAPSDSTTDRTLDQMCTVTRPGVALMAGSLAVELLVSILQHKERQFAPSTNSGFDTTLGCVPHQIRGFLHNFENVKLTSKNYKYCSACSLKVLKEYSENGWEFVKLALNNSKYLEDLTGLTEVQRQAEEASDLIDIIDSDEEFE